MIELCYGSCYLLLCNLVAYPLITKKAIKNAVHLNHSER